MNAFTRKHTALAFALMLAHAQGAWAGTTTVVLTGSAAPGTGSGLSFATLSVPQLSNAGQVAFAATLSGAGVTTLNNNGIWRDSFLIAREGNAAPGTGSGVTFAGLSASPQLSAAGQVAYRATLTGTGINPANDASLWLDSRLIAQTGSAAPGAGEGANFASLSSFVTANAAGQVAYQASLNGTGINSGNDGGIWRDNSLVARTGSAAPGTGSGVTFKFVSLQNINAAGQVLYLASLNGTGINSTNDAGIWRDSTLIAREGDAAPGTVPGVRFLDHSDSRLNASGQVAYRARLTGTDINSSNDTGIWRDSSLIARTGDAAPGTASGVSFSSVFSPQINDAGQVLFRGELSGAGVTSGNNIGIWRDSTLIVREGQAAAGVAGGATIASMGAAQLNAGGQVAFRAGLAGAGVSSANNEALYLSDGVESILVVRNGDTVAGSTISLSPTSISEGSFNDKAQLAYRANLADGSSGLFLFTPTLHWRSTTSGSWDDAARWTLGVNPADVHDVIVDAANSLRITGPTGAVTVKSLQVGTGAGVVTLQMAGGSIAAGEPVLIGARGVLSGTGSFSGPVINQGTVQADRLAMSAGLSNAGLVRGVAGGPQTGAGLGTDLLNQASGRVLVQPGETLQLRGASHRNLGVFEINQGRLEVAGTLLNGSGGVIDLNRATAVADGAWTNAAGARLLLSDARLTVSGGLSNAGQVLVTSGNSGVFGSVVNQTGGQILLSGQGTTTFYDAVELQAGSELRTSAGASAVFFGAVAQRSGALLTGTGQKYFEGGLSIGNSPGLGEDAGSVSFGLGSIYLAEIGGTVLGTGYDHYRVAGTLTLGGTLQLVSFDGFTGEAGQQFDLFDWGALQGQFSSIDSSGLQLAAGTTLDVSRLYIDGVISVTAVPEPGSWALMAAGLAGLAGLRRRNAARNS
jgi:hypothetical protein